MAERGEENVGPVELKKVGERNRREQGRLSTVASGGKGGRWAQGMTTTFVGM